MHVCESCLCQLYCRNAQEHRCACVAEFGVWKLHTMNVKSGGEKDGAACAQCRSSGDGARMLLCDRCNTGWHMYCLPSPLAEIPDGDWACPTCIRYDELRQHTNDDDGDIICEEIGRAHA